MSESNARPHFDFEALRARLGDGREYWRSLDELSGSPDVQKWMEDEFGPEAMSFEDGFSRRRFFHLMGASLALGGLAACTRQPPERIVPFVEAPEDLVPGRPLYYATTILSGGYGIGVLAESHMGRPTKLEGNPDHPASLGGSDARTQAAILSLYDPDRSRNVMELGAIRTWKAFHTAVKPALDAQRAIQGRGLRILTETVTSPTLTAQLEALLATYPEANWHVWEPVHTDGARAGRAAALGTAADLRFDLTAADVIVTLDADLLGEGPGAIRYAKDFGRRRKVGADGAGMNRLYAIESCPSATGSIADHRLALAPAQIGKFAAALLDALSGQPASGDSPQWVAAIAEDLRGRIGRALVVAGDHLPAPVHTLAAAINERIGAWGKTVFARMPADRRPESRTESLTGLVADMEAGHVDVLVVLGGNPVFTAPADSGFVAAFDRVPLRIHHGLEIDETGERCHWHLPATHELESWSDAAAFDGTLSLIQPVIEPIFDGKTSHEVVAALAGVSDAKAHDLVRAHWQTRLGPIDFEAQWRKLLHDGWLPGSASPALAVSMNATAVGEAVAVSAAAYHSSATAGSEITLILRPDPTIGDGRFANNGWLQELPKPITRLVWDNALMMAPALAKDLGLGDRDLARVEVDGRSVDVPVWVTLGHADGAATLHFGYGRRRVGKVGAGTGTDVYPLRSAKAPWLASAKISATGRQGRLVTTQMHGSMEGRELVREATLEAFRAHPRFAHESEHVDEHLSMYPGWTYTGHAWGLSIDLSSCTGCGACTMACQSENNIPVVGRDQVERGREMHWIRVDRYFGGTPELPTLHHQPVPCMHCEQAPCEVVCPVGATVHSDEGLNDMVYNRCVGTRYCSNNCPYKVRRFNFLKYHDTDDPVLALGRNPDVTVRVRGVMEKCTYCVQRINVARIDAKRTGREMKDGDVTTACQQACPTEAIVFGDLNDSSSRIAKLKQSPLDYALLGELGTRPRTTYLARVRNANPALEREAPPASEEHHATTTPSEFPV